MFEAVASLPALSGYVWQQGAGREEMAAVGNAALHWLACRSRPWVRGLDLSLLHPQAAGESSLAGPPPPAGGPWRAMGEEPAWLELGGLLLKHKAARGGCRRLLAALNRLLSLPAFRSPCGKKHRVIDG